ncbi:MAG: hypothetical protein R3F53_26575 [Gammaproteobacteria bacterium]
MKTKTEYWQDIWQRARSHQHTLVLGAVKAPAAPSDLHVITINCASPSSTIGPLDEAQQQILRLLGEAANTLSAPSARTGLRFWLLEDTPDEPYESRFVAVCNRLAEWDNGRAALCLTGIESADPATLSMLGTILQRPDWLQLPLLMLSQKIVGDAVDALAERLRQTSGEDLVLQLSSEPAADLSAASFDWDSLPAEVLRIFRAGAVIGTVFDVELVARLLEESPGYLFEQLQFGFDAGAPFADLGNGRFGLTPEVVAELRGQLLPSLLRHWNQRLGVLLGETQAMEEAPEASAADVQSAQQAPVNAAPTDEKPREQQQQPSDHDGKGTEPSKFVNLFEAAPSPQTEPPDAKSESAPANAQPKPEAVADNESQPAPNAPPTADRLRAAVHLQEAGEIDAAMVQYLLAVQELANRGDTKRAYLVAQEALQSLTQLPQSEQRALRQAQLLLEIGQLQWQGLGLGEPITLAQALKTLQAARSTLPETASAELLSRLATVTAGVCYDLGDNQSLQAALSDLAATSRILMTAGASLEAACLLSDQAAIYVRQGDPVQAAHLLDKARELFERLLNARQNEALAVSELAKVHHLYARLILHARIRSGREQDAFAMGLEHAQLAEQFLRQTGAKRELGRVWETAGRLALQAGRLNPAGEYFSAALELQKQLGDVTGLARTTAGLAELCMHTGQLEDALAMLSDSVTLNVEKGSPVGLAFNRSALRVLMHAIASQTPENAALRVTANELEHRLQQAEDEFGRIEFTSAPGSR